MALTFSFGFILFSPNESNPLHKKRGFFIAYSVAGDILKP